MADLPRMRAEYEAHGLLEADLVADPMEQFDLWLHEAIAAGATEPNAMVLSTVDAEGQPWSRYVLLKGLSEGGFEFYTNYTSAKGRHLSGSARAAIVFGWLQLHRQVCVAGVVEQLPAEVSDEYFAVRPRGSQLGAWASAQSSVLPDRTELEHRVVELDEQYAGNDVPRPPHWGGYRLTPTSLEFWQGRPDRLHDRLRYRRSGDAWFVERLSP